MTPALRRSLLLWSGRSVAPAIDGAVLSVTSRRISGRVGIRCAVIGMAPGLVPGQIEAEQPEVVGATHFATSRPCPVSARMANTPRAMINMLHDICRIRSAEPTWVAGTCCITRGAVAVMAVMRIAHPTVTDRPASGWSARTSAPPAGHAGWRPADDRARWRGVTGRAHRRRQGAAGQRHDHSSRIRPAEGQGAGLTFPYPKRLRLERIRTPRWPPGACRIDAGRFGPARIGGRLPSGHRGLPCLHPGRRTVPDRHRRMAHTHIVDATDEIDQITSTPQEPLRNLAIQLSERLHMYGAPLPSIPESGHCPFRRFDSASGACHRTW